MNTKKFKLAISLFLLVIGTRPVSAQLIGQVDRTFVTGSNLFCVPVSPSKSGSNALSELFSSPSTPPNNTTVSFWNPVDSSFDTSSTFSNGSWSVDLVMTPGMGASLVAPSPFTNVFIGYLLDHNGNLITNDPVSFPPPPIFSSPGGVYLLGDKAPAINTGTDVFLNVIGRLPFVGEQITQPSGTSTYLGNGTWDSIPTLDVASAGFFKITQPRLSILFTNNQAIVSWPASVLGWTLQTNTDLATSNWGNYTGPVVNNMATNSPPGGRLFFRLISP